MNFFREIPLFCAPEYVMDYYHKHKYSYLLAGIHCAQAHDGRIGFLNRQDCDVFQKRVFHLRMRNEMTEAFDNITYDEKKLFHRACIGLPTYCNCNCNTVLGCPHILYEEIVKLHDIIVPKKKEDEKEDGPPPLVSCPSDESMRKYKDLPKNVQSILFPKGGEVVFDTREEADSFERQVENESSFFNPPPKKKDDLYIDRVVSLLHSVAALAAQNKSLTQELVGSSLQTFASFLVKTRVEEGGLKMFEDTIRVATDSNNPFSLLFAKYDKLTPPQKCIVKGLLNIMNKKEGEPWIYDAATQCLLLKEDGVDTQVLMEFLK